MVDYGDVTFINIRIDLPKEPRQPFGDRLKKVPLLDLGEAEIEDWSMLITNISEMFPSISMRTSWSQITIREGRITARISGEPPEKTTVFVGDERSRQAIPERGMVERFGSDLNMLVMHLLDPLELPGAYRIRCELRIPKALTEPILDSVPFKDSIDDSFQKTEKGVPSLKRIGVEWKTDERTLFMAISEKEEDDEVVLTLSPSLIENHDLPTFNLGESIDLLLGFTKDITATIHLEV